MSSPLFLASQHEPENMRTGGLTASTSTSQRRSEAQTLRRDHEKEEEARARALREARVRSPTIMIQLLSHGVQKLTPARVPYEEPLSRHDLGRMDKMCQSCGALHWASEEVERGGFGTCCHHGKTIIPLLQAPPDPLRYLFTSLDSQAREFRANIWRYSLPFQFTSMAIEKVDESVNRSSFGSSTFRPVFRIQGELFHRHGSLLPAPGADALFAQVYTYNPDEALQIRQTRTGLRDETVALLHSIITKFNSYAGIYHMAGAIIRQYPQPEDMNIILRVTPGANAHTHNLPMSSEVAVLLPTNGDIGGYRDIILHGREGPLERISELHASYDPLQYPLFFPQGQDGWHLETQSTVGRKVTLQEYTAFRLFPRRHEFSTILRGGRMLERWVVDHFAAIESQRLRNHLSNQHRYRTTIASGMQDILSTSDLEHVDLNSIGTRTILPSSYPGSPRHMYQQLQDSLAIARFFRKVDLFITITCNPHWPEITRESYPGQSSYDRVELVTRVFKEKVDAIMEDIRKNHIFGQCVADVTVIEFQKRGLPHAHCLIFLKEGSKIVTPQDVDSIISAEWPDPIAQPKLFDTVSKCMVHGPCGSLNPAASCMDQETKRCSKKYV
jgi:hypothetical protein